MIIHPTVSGVNVPVDNWRRAVLHVDGDAFFASCEVSRDPSLRGRPVVVGGVRGIALALTYEAKARGVTRGMPTFEVRRVCPEAVILPGNYELYGLIALRMYAIVRRYAGIVEEYSIDECFADITNACTTQHQTYLDIAHAVKRDLEGELGVSFSVGVAPSKVLAKVASKYRKPSGLVCIEPHAIHEYLRDTPVSKLWGVGQATAQFLHTRGIVTALQFAQQSEWWVKANLTKPHRIMWQELNGVAVYDVHAESSGDQKSVASTRTFRPPSKDRAYVRAQLSKNIEEACARARMGAIRARAALCFLKSQDFQYRRFEVPLVSPTNTQSVVLQAVLPQFEQNFVPGILYRATGVTLSAIEHEGVDQLNLFSTQSHTEDAGGVMRAYDSIRARYGKGSIFLASSMAAYTHASKKYEVEKHFKFPYLGEVG